MGEVAEIVGGGTPRTSEPSNWNGDVPWITPADLSGYRTKAIASGARSISKQGLASSGARILPTGTVLMSSRAPVGYVAIAAIPISTNQGFKSFVLRDGLLPDYVYWYLKRSRDLLNEFASGTTFPEVSGRRAAEIPIPIAPLAEQRRIVAALEEHLSDLDSAVAGLERAKANTKRYEAALLDTATSRVEGVSTGWHEFAVSEVAETITGTTPPTSDPRNYGGDLPFFKPTDLNAGYELRHAREHLTPNGAAHARKLPAGAVLVTCIGATIGKTAMSRVECATNQQINAAVVDDTRASPEWLFWFFRSPRGQRAIKASASATTLPILNKSKFSALRLPLPPLDEQRRIIANIERCVSVSSRTAAEIDVQLTRAARLRQSILRQAFEGKLVPQDPSDEPASASLTRCREGAQASSIAKRARTSSSARRERN